MKRIEILIFFWDVLHRCRVHSAPMITLHFNRALKSLCPWSCVRPGQYELLDLRYYLTHDRSLFSFLFIFLVFFIWRFVGYLGVCSPNICGSNWRVWIFLVEYDDFDVFPYEIV